MLARIRDEAHRFANTFHRDRRSKASLRCQLDDIPGIGLTRRQRLLKHFGSVRAVRQASRRRAREGARHEQEGGRGRSPKYFADLERGGGNQAIDQEIAEAIDEPS